MEREIGRGGRFPGKLGKSKSFCHGRCQKTVVRLCLFRKPEKPEEDECAKDGSPPSGLEPINISPVLFHRDSGELGDMRVPPVCVGPGDPRINLIRDSVPDYHPCGQRDGEAEIKGGQGNETPVAAEIQAGVGGDYISNLPSPLQEGPDGEGCV